MVSDRDELIRNMSRKLFLNTVRGSAACRHQPYAMTHTKDMRIDSKCSLSPHYRLYYISRFTPYTRQAHQFFQRTGNLTTKVAHQHLRHAYQMLCLVVGG